jgi:hypothetical protein
MTSDMETGHRETKRKCNSSKVRLGPGPMVENKKGLVEWLKV